jgi:hypothetical protein
MGYLQIFGGKLDELLRTHGMGDAARANVVAYVKDIVLESYRNGVEKGRQERDEKRRPHGRPKKRK